MSPKDYLLDSFQSFVDTKNVTANLDKLPQQTLNTIINLFYGLTKFIWYLLDFLLSLIARMNLFGDMMVNVFNISATLYRALASQLGFLFVSLALVYYFYLFTVKSSHEANRRLMVLLLVLVVNTGFYTQGVTLLRHTQTFITQVENTVIGAVMTPISDDLNNVRRFGTSVLLSNPEVENGTNQAANEQTVTLLSDYLFYDSVVVPFASMNFGKSQFDEALMSPYLIKSTETNVIGARDDIIRLYERESVQNIYLTDMKLNDKFWVALFSVFNVFLVGGVVVMVMFLKVLFQLLVLALIIALPIISMISLLPKFNTALFHALGKGVIWLFTASIMSIAAVIVFFLFNVLMKGIYILSGDATSFAVYPAAVLAKIGLLLVLWKKRKELVSFITADKIRSTNTLVPFGSMGQFLQERSRHVKESFQSRFGKSQDKRRVPEAPSDGAADKQPGAQRFKLQPRVNNEDVAHFRSVYNGTPQPNTDEPAADKQRYQKPRTVHVVPERDTEVSEPTQKRPIKPGFERLASDKVKTPKENQTRSHMPKTAEHEAERSLNRHTPLDELKQRYPHATPQQLKKRPNMWAKDGEWEQYFADLEQTNASDPDRIKNFEKRLKRMRS